MRNSNILKIAIFKILLSIAFICILKNAYAQKAKFDFQKEFEITARLIVMIRAGGDNDPEIGAGVIFGRDKQKVFIVTAYHVISNIPEPKNIRVQFRGMPKDKYLPAKL